jgi:hypothetical protein
MSFIARLTPYDLSQAPSISKLRTNSKHDNYLAQNSIFWARKLAKDRSSFATFHAQILPIRGKRGFSGNIWLLKIITHER